MQDYFKSLNFNDMLGHLVATLIVLFILRAVIRAHDSSKYKYFDLTDLVTDDNYRINGSKFRLSACFIVMTWGFIYLCLHQLMTEWYATIYVGAFVADRISSRLVLAKSNSIIPSISDAITDGAQAVTPIVTPTPVSTLITTKPQHTPRPRNKD